jgi:hypothetical protein
MRWYAKKVAVIVKVVGPPGNGCMWPGKWDLASAGALTVADTAAEAQHRSILSRGDAVKPKRLGFQFRPFLSLRTRASNTNTSSNSSSLWCLPIVTFFFKGLNCLATYYYYYITQVSPFRWYIFVHIMFVNKGLKIDLQIETWPKFVDIYLYILWISTLIWKSRWYMLPIQALSPQVLYCYSYCSFMIRELPCVI